MYKILSIIPARGGSKGLKRKNILNLAGKPLLAWSIEASLNSKYISKTVVSSEDRQILHIAKEYGVQIHKRSHLLALDDTTSQDVVRSILMDIGREFDYFILLQPTSPLRDSDDIDVAIELLIEKRADSLISVKEYENKILKAFVYDEKGFLKGVSNDKYPFVPRQKLPDVYMSNGAIYICKIDKFLESNSFLGDRAVKYIMNEEKSLDIDTKEDFDKVSKIMEHKLLTL